MKRSHNLNPANDDEPVRRTCKHCRHPRMWHARQGPNPLYKFKCCKCGKWER